MKLMLLFLLAAVSVTAQTSNEPTRIIKDQRIDLKPLLTWWANYIATKEVNGTNYFSGVLRPLKDWNQLRVSDIKINGALVTAQVWVKDYPNQKERPISAVLRHAPLVSKQRFDAQVAALRKNELDRKNFSGAATDPRTHERAVALKNEQERLEKALNGKTVYTFTDFALATGEVYAGLPVYDFGLTLGK